MAGRIPLEQEIGNLADLSRDGLNRRWRRAFSCAPPRGVQRGLLELGVAWHLQVKAFGGLSPQTRRQLQRLVDQRRNIRRGAGQDEPQTDMPEGEAGSRGSVGKSTVGKAGTASPAAALAPGTRLVREWHGRTHHVEIIEDGFVFEGRTHAALSAIARQITGARWSGPRFFGLGQPLSRKERTKSGTGEAP